MIRCQNLKTRQVNQENNETFNVTCQISTIIKSFDQPFNLILPIINGMGLVCFFWLIRKILLILKNTFINTTTNSERKRCGYSGSKSHMSIGQSRQIVKLKKIR